MFQIPRWLLLATLFVASFLWLLLLRSQTPAAEQGIANIPLVWAMLAGFLPYLLACALVLFTRAPVGRQCLFELSIIIGGGLLLRLLVVHSWPTLSRDVWTYLWDGNMLAHGYNPLRYSPNDPALSPLRDMVYDQSRFRNVPGIYPPLAQSLFWLTGLISPENLTVWKGFLVLSDLGSMVVLAWLLHKNRMDPSRCLLYAWSPLPIVEYAQNGHLDALVVLLVLLALCAQMGTSKRSRVLVGILLSLATLIKLYPAILLCAFLKKRDWRMPLSFGVTLVGIVLLYRVIAGPGILGAIFLFASQVDNTNAGPVVLLLHQMQSYVPLLPTTISRLCEVVIGLGGIVVAVQTYRGWLSLVDGTAILCAVFFACSTHVFPWYLCVFLPLIAIGLPRRPYLLLLWCTIIVNTQYFIALSLHWEHYTWAMYLAPGLLLVEPWGRRLFQHLRLRQPELEKAPTHPLELQESRL